LGTNDTKQKNTVLIRTKVGKENISRAREGSLEDYENLYSNDDGRSRLLLEVWPGPFRDPAIGSPIKTDMINMDILELTRDKKSLQSQSSGGGLITKQEEEDGFTSKLQRYYLKDDSIVSLCETALFLEVVSACLAARNLIPDSTGIFDFLKDKDLLAEMFCSGENFGIQDYSRRMNALRTLPESIKKSARNMPGKEIKTMAGNIALTITGLIDQHEYLYQCIQKMMDLL